MQRRVPVLLPAQRRSKWSARQFIASLPSVALSVAEVGFAESASVGLHHCILTTPSKRLPFETIGDQLGVSKQAVEGSWKRLRRRLRDTMLYNRYQHCTIHFKPEFLEPIR